MQDNNNKSELYTHIENNIPTLEQKLLPSNPHLQLQEQEEIIQKGLNGFMEAGTALGRIKEDKLYKDNDNYSTYNDYCQERWGFTPQYGNRLIKASVLIEVMKSETIVSVLPQSESQVRALLKSENPADEWIEAQVITGKEQPTAKEITEASIKNQNKEEDIIDAEIDKEIVEEASDKTANETSDETKSANIIILLEEIINAPYEMGERTGRPQVSVDADDASFARLTQLKDRLSGSKGSIVAQALIFMEKSLDSISGDSIPGK